MLAGYTPSPRIYTGPPRDKLPPEGPRDPAPYVTHAIANGALLATGPLLPPVPPAAATSASVGASASAAAVPPQPAAPGAPRPSVPHVTGHPGAVAHGPQGSVGYGMPQHYMVSGAPGQAMGSQPYSGGVAAGPPMLGVPHGVSAQYIVKDEPQYLTKG